ncbi:unnamed protein product, partial [Peniophora sp. CBMAI 1063]
MSEPRAPSFRFTDLPAELVVSIILLAQTAWHKEQFSAQAPYAGVKRYEVSRPPSASSAVLPCCDGLRWDFSRPTCILSSSDLPAGLPSPAHSASQVCRWLRGILLEENSAIWRLDNTLYPSIAQRSGETRTILHGQTILGYGALSLVAVDVCICVLRGLSSFYSSLQWVKLRLPWSGDRSLVHELQQFLYNNRGRANSPLRHFDLEALDPKPLQVGRRGNWHVTAVESEELQASRFSGTDIFYYSKTLNSLCLHHRPDSDIVFFGVSLSTGLSACAATIEFLTIDIGGRVGADIEGSVAFPKLRHFRLCTDPGFAPLLLRWMILPYALDLHLEVIESWRKSFVTKHAGIYELPFWPSEHAPPLLFLFRQPQDFVQSLAQPHRTTTIQPNLEAHYPVAADDPAEMLWRRSTSVIGLDVRIDPSTKSREPAAARFPELVGVTFAESVDELRPVLEDPVARDWERSRDLEGKTAARRSLTFRDGQFSERERARDFNSQCPKALYDTLRYVLAAVPG